ncbi:MAG: TPM domain-containing protein [Calditrichia bacterium]
MTEKRSANPQKFFGAEEKEKIVDSIREAEKETSGEIRLHLEEKAKKDVMQRAQEVFYKIGMSKTAGHNGVLIYMATADKQFAIIGDKGINELVPENFWQDVVDDMVSHFKKDEFVEGICHGIIRIGEKLKDYFPYQRDDVDELPDDISFDKK